MANPKVSGPSTPTPVPSPQGEGDLTERPRA